MRLSEVANTFHVETTTFGIIDVTVRHLEHVDTGHTG